MGEFLEYCKKHNESNYSVFNLFLDTYKSLNKELDEIEELLIENYGKLLKSGATNAEFLLQTNFEDLYNKHDEIERLLADCEFLIWRKKKYDNKQMNIFEHEVKKK